MTPRPKSPAPEHGVRPGKRSSPLDADERRHPKQQRSRETVDAILQAAICVLERGSFEAFNVHAIAAEAGVNVATLYSYFANKHKLLERLTQDWMDERIEMLHGAFDEAAAAPDWVASLCDAIAHLARLRVAQAGSIALRRALHASSRLWELDQEGNRAAARMIAELLEKRADPRPADPELRSRIIAEYITAILDMKAQYAPETYPAIDREMVALLRAHLTMP